MMELAKRLWRDEAGAFLNSAELVFLSAILVIGLIPGWVFLKKAILIELRQMAHAVLGEPGDKDDHPGKGPPIVPPGHGGTPPGKIATADAMFGGQ